MISELLHSIHTWCYRHFCHVLLLFWVIYSPSFKAYYYFFLFNIVGNYNKNKLLLYHNVTEMNRHHYALFVRNCRLILLLRRDFSEGDLNIFRPAEWRWKLPQVISTKEVVFRLTYQHFHSYYFACSDKLRSAKSRCDRI